MWRSIKEGPEKFFSQIMYNVGEGCHVSFWHNPWCGPIPLKEFFPAMFAYSLSKEAWVSDLVISTYLLLKEVEGVGIYFSIMVLRIRRQTLFILFLSLFIPSMPRGEGDDHLVWRLTKFGVFDLHSFYKLLSSPNTDEFPWECIWCAKVPKWVSFFLWTAANDGILTIDNLVKRGWFLVNRCCLCNCDGESVDHLLLHCKLSHALWCETFAVSGSNG